MGNLKGLKTLYLKNKKIRNMGNNGIFTLLQRINYTKYGLQYIDFNEVVEVIRNGDLVLYDSEYGEYTLIWGIERSGFFNDRGKWVKGFENQRV